MDTAVREYTEPKLTFHGHVDELTLSQSAMFGAQFMAAFAASVITNSPGEESGPTVTEGPGETIDGPQGAVTTLADGESGGAGGGSAPGGGVTETDSSGGKLPFTGMAASATAAGGMLVFTAGAFLRKITRSSR